MSKDLILPFIHQYDEVLQNDTLTCGDLIDLKELFYRDIKKSPRITEWLLFQWLYHYLGMTSPLHKGEVSKENVILLQEKRYNAKFKKQNIDITIKNKHQLAIGISVKVSSKTSAYLDGADFNNPILMNDYRQCYVQDEDEFERKKKAYLQEKKSKDRIKVPTLLQDMARLENVQEGQQSRFQSLTVIYGHQGEADKEWVNEFSKRFGHHYLYLADEATVKLQEALEKRLPSLSTYVHKNKDR